MSEAFDPYVQWLGIRDPDRPPNHYRLLGVDLFEDDPEVLTNAADRQMAHVRTFQTGRHSAHSQKLLNELAAAKLCLLSPQRKADYDAWLRGQLELGAQGAVFPTAAAATREVPTPADPQYTWPAAAGPAGLQQAAAPIGTSSPEGGSRIVSITIGVLTAMVLVLLGLIALVVLRGRPAEKRPAPVAATPGPQATAIAHAKRAAETEPAQAARAGPEAAPKPEPNSQFKPGPTPEPKTEPKSEPKPGSQSQPGPTPEPQPDSRAQAQPSEAQPASSWPPSESITAGAAGKTDDLPSAASPPQPASQAPSGQEPAPATAAAGGKLPVPEQAAQARALQQIRRTFRDAYAASEKPEQKLRLARTLLEQASETNDDPPARYVLLAEARDQALDAGDLNLFSQAVGTLAEQYSIDPWAMKAESLHQAAKRARTVSATQALTGAAIRLVQQAITQDRYSEAAALAELARETARRAKDTARIKEAVAIRREVDVSKQYYEAFLQASEILAQQPDDPEANLAQGKYYCFVKGDWAHGLPLLVKGNDAILKALAQAETAGAGSAQQMVALGDQWWDAVNSVDGAAQRLVQARAVHWYRKAMPGLAGLTKARVERRLEELDGVRPRAHK